MAYVLGFFAADGYITVNRRGAHFWCIEIIDKPLLESIKKVIGADHKISVRPTRGDKSVSYRLQIGSKDMCNDLRRLGFSERKTKNLSVPRVPEKYFRYFVRGYFDGDGNVWVGYTHKERNTPSLVVRSVFTSSSEVFLKHLRNRLEKQGVRNGVMSKGQGNYYRLTYSVHGALKLYDFMYNERDPVPQGLYLTRKKKVFERYKKLRP